MTSPFDHLMKLLTERGLVSVPGDAGIRVPDLFDPDKAVQNSHTIAAHLRAVANELLEADPAGHRARPLYLDGGRESGVWYCSECRLTGPSKEAVELCCAKPKCVDCGADAARYSKLCEPCWSGKQAARARVRWEAAEVVGGADAYFVEDEDGHDVGPHDGWFYDHGGIQDWVDEWRWEHPSAPDPVLYVFEGEPTKMRFNANGLIENALEEAHEEAYSEVSQEAIGELQAALDAWCAKYSPIWYEVTYAKKVLWTPEDAGEDG